MPTTSERRPISRLTRSSGFVDLSLLECSDGKRVEAEQILLGVEQQLRDLRGDGLQALDDLGQPLARLGASSAAKMPRMAAAGSLRSGRLRKWTVQRATGAEDLPDRGLEALVAV